MNRLLLIILRWRCARRREALPQDLIDKLLRVAHRLLEAGDGLAIAVDKLDEAHNEVTRTKELIRRAKSG